MTQAHIQADASYAPAIRYSHELGNVARLSVAQALAGANAVVIFATGAIVGHTLAPSPALATLPISAYVVGMAGGTLPAGAITRAYGRRATFLVGTGCGVLVGLLAALAVWIGSFWLYSAAMLFGGVYGAVVQSFRFAAAECAPPARQARSMSAVLAGGIFAGVIGTELVTYTMNLWSPYLFLATYLAQAGIAFLSAFVLIGVRLERPSAAEIAAGRPLALIVRQPRFVAAVVCGVVSYMLMNFVMTAAPLAMRLCGLTQADANLGLQWHVIAMYAPSFFTGRLVTRFGAQRIVAAGLLLLGASAVAGLAGIDRAHFLVAMVLLGLGWNFGFLGASALVLECHRPEEAAKVQSFNDFAVFGTMMLGSFSSGGLLSGFGWATVLWVSFGPLALAGLALALAPRLRVTTA